MFLVVVATDLRRTLFFVRARFFTIEKLFRNAVKTRFGTDIQSHTCDF